jgi:hypothetical protein
MDVIPELTMTKDGFLSAFRALSNVEMYLWVAVLRFTSRAHWVASRQCCFRKRRDGGARDGSEATATSLAIPSPRERSLIVEHALGYCGIEASSV